MTKDEALKMALETLETWKGYIPHLWDKTDEQAITAIKEALAQPEPIKIAHKHEWFRTGEMKVGQMRCISCGTWGQEEMPQRTWVGLTDEEIQYCVELKNPEAIAEEVEVKLKEKNT